MPLELLFNPIIKATTALGVPVPLAEANFYASGSSSVRQDTYADALQATPNANPVVADANGVFPQIYLLPLAYHVVITGPGGVTTYFDEDPIAGGLFNALFDDSWQLKDNSDPTKILKFQLSGITTGTTRTKTVADTNATLLDSLYATMGAARLKENQGDDVTAANDLTLSSNGNTFVVNGNTQINRIATANWQNGAKITLIFAGTPTLTNGTATGGGFAQLILNGAVSLVAAANNTLSLVLAGGSWFEIGRKV